MSPSAGDAARVLLQLPITYKPGSIREWSQARNGLANTRSGKVALFEKLIHTGGARASGLEQIFC